ncbi:TRAP transporter substrate-binding protein DctP [Halomonas sp. ISL-60]|uniref:TRAP transporter substrate-binding protein n=1 Tax=unclassified Halomonas TaxID=2609666 RepID=UPI0007DA288E|nr:MULTISPECIES: TRAP transporter substrate-binding protein DctP [unclassified Halomonas]MBT2771232.1 TRAP transporter substrate-binding protein DctP [Halomonas sp. ISL-60]MBT2786613.1 TRAP transporter substrate-binding protein DctP [Halomonas sp. ISL-106]MBT2797635.1 TRAP transporter substrate-binding protein DctP [Halomonas sp. ISL-104]MBT2802831.1 TRAP transporter substrate-binding protein DctP [Halomonas sp. ISL-56]OAL58982.1 C4-dicarboxylate ABC transporter [Halomonas sp. ALS9]
MKASKSVSTINSVTTKLLTTASVGALLFGLSAAAQADNWRYAHEEYEGDVQDVFAYAFKEYIEDNSDHTVQVYRFGELGESDDIMEQTQNGILQFVNQSPGFTGALIPEAQIFFIPYLLPTDEETVLTFFDESKAINEMFPALYAEQGLELLKMYPEGEMVITTNEPFATPDELNNKKIRTMTNPLLTETYDAFGATPTPLPWGEVYGGLQTGIIDGQENPIFWIESGGLYEVSPHLTFTGHGWFTTAMMANQDFYEGLSEEDQTLVNEASEAAYDHTIEHIKGLAEESLEKIQAASDEVTVTRLDEEQIQAFRERAPQVEEAFLEMTGEGGAELLEQFKADLEAVTNE